MALVAPVPIELARATHELDDRLARASAVALAMGRLHATWGEALAAGVAPDACKDPSFGSLAARSRAFGAAYRDAVQDARAAADRLAYLHEAATVAPLLDEADRSAFAHARAATEHHVAVYLEMSAWQTRFVEPAARGCVLSIERADGVAWSGAVATTDLRAAAVFGVGGGFVCPGAVPADGRVAVVQGSACVAVDASCGCVPVAVLPGAVLTP